MSVSAAQPVSGHGLRTVWTHATNVLGVLPLSIMLLTGRIAVASVFLKSGLTKIQSWDVAIQLFQQEYQVPVLPPEVAATLATSFELGCSTLLILGLFTRLATLPLIGMVFVIEIFVYPEAWVDHLMWFTLLLFILSRGPGVFSLDTVLGRLVWGRQAN